MTNKKLENDEYILLDSVSVTMTDGPFAKPCNLYLTNKNIILEKKAIFLGKIQSVSKYPLSDIIILNGKPLVSSRSESFMSYLDIKTKNGPISVCFAESFGKKEPIKWVNTIFNVLVGHDSDEKTLGSSVADMVCDFSSIGKNAVETFSGSFANAFKAIYKEGKEAISSSIPRAINAKCIGCGMPISGLSGTIVKCEYCDTKQALKENN